MRIALDAMGGDYGPVVTVAGAVEAARAFGVEVRLVGRPEAIEPELAKHDTAGLKLAVVPASEEIAMDEHPARAVREKRDSSIVVGVDLVKRGEADAFVSAGNTGGVLVASLLGFRRIEGITSERPALATVYPTLRGHCVVLDVGANVDCKPEWLAQFALMGSIYAERIVGIRNPTVATLSNGEEETKGNELVLAAIPLIKRLPVRYVGNVEGKDVPFGKADVVVGDGFVVNVFIKTSEGVAAVLVELLRAELTRTPVRKLLALGLRPAFRALRRRMDYAEFGGAPLLGVNGVAVVAHGRSNALAIKNAIRVAREAVERDLVGQIRAGVERARFGRPA